MKKLPYLVSCMFLVTALSCTPPEDNEAETVIVEAPDESLLIEGAWRMQSRITYENGLPIDTVVMGDRYAQVKMYVDGSVMWSQMTPEDSAKWYGYGSYMVMDGELIELMEYGSDEFMKFLQTQNKFEFELIIEDDTYTQIGMDSLGLPANAEHYVRVN